ncbi:hypothetical protein [Qipengyuania qiaonensis]|uniref:Uncharacterized protein n=1 Tax=Qipengyuania qiaonensis TaxID=2867240 RepID=A0ABS7J4F0_9SPHN|nr:hypothetical protein [Qipengyuania qiaonensis]MBX7482213.1 hypothetical protein [Qipengyuania qiaonensis]
MELVKAVPLGAILTFVVALLIGSQGSKGGELAIFHVEIYSYDFWWSWPLFFGGTALAWGIMMLQR